MGRTLEEFLVTKASVAVLVGGAATTIIGTQLSGADLGAAGILQNFLPLGAPAMVGMVVANAVLPLTTKKGPQNDAIRGGIAGATCLGILVGTGAIPFVLDSQTAVLILTVAGGTMIGDYVSALIIT